MNSCFDTLASFIEAQSWAFLTTVDREGGIHTRPVRSMRAPFTGQIWLEAAEGSVATEIADDAEVSVAFGDASHGPYVTIAGWAVMTRARKPAPHAWRHRPSQHGARAATETRPVLCITACAAKMWETAPMGTARIFAFPPVHPAPVAEDALPPRLASFRPSLPFPTSGDRAI